MFENVAMAEKLCYLNGWDHFAVPISALEAALRHEQLDTVAFYLKTKGKGNVRSVAEVKIFVAYISFIPHSYTSAKASSITFSINKS